MPYYYRNCGIPPNASRGSGYMISKYLKLMAIETPDH